MLGNGRLLRRKKLVVYLEWLGNGISSYYGSLRVTTHYTLYSSVAPMGRGSQPPGCGLIPGCTAGGEQ